MKQLIRTVYITLWNVVAMTSANNHQAIILYDLMFNGKFYLENTECEYTCIRMHAIVNK